MSARTHGHLLSSWTKPISWSTLRRFRLPPHVGRAARAFCMQPNRYLTFMPHLAVARGGGTILRRSLQLRELFASTAIHAPLRTAGPATTLRKDRSHKATSHEAKADTAPTTDQRAFNTAWRTKFSRRNSCAFAAAGLQTECR